MISLTTSCFQFPCGAGPKIRGPDLKSMDLLDEIPAPSRNFSDPLVLALDCV